MDFPRFVFISPGKDRCQGGTYDGELVHDQAEFDSAVKAGYSATLPEALKAADDARTLAKAKEIEAATPKIPKAAVPKPPAPATGG